MASALENFVNTVRTLSASGNFRELAEHLPDTADLLTKNWTILDNVLETLDMQQHSLGVLYVVIAKFESSAIANAEAGKLINLFKDFIQRCNGEQVRFAVQPYYHMCHLFTYYIVNKPNCIVGVKHLAKAIEKIRKFESQQTPVHADLYLISLKSKFFKVALPFLDIDITDISTYSEGRAHTAIDINNDSKHYLLYYYYGGMIYTALKNYERALYFFEVCLSTPAMAMSHIMLEAYKKFILVALILQGKLMPLPKYSSQVVTRYMKPLAIIYHDLANAYATKNSDDLRTVINKYSEVYARDNNLGLVKQVAFSLYKKNIQRLTKTFLTLSLSDVASRVQLLDAVEAEKFILHMIKSGEIYATINQKDGMVVFKENPEKYNTPDMFLKLQQSMTDTMDLVNKVHDMEERIVLNPMYIKKAFGSNDDELISQHHKVFVNDPMD